MSKVGRNEPCPCGSGKKYKKCHSGQYEPAALFAEEAGTYEIVVCAVNDDYRELSLATVIIVRAIPDSDRFVIAVFLCDIFCLGVKDLTYENNVMWSRVENVLISKSTQQSFDEVDYQKARAIVIGSVDYARSLGFEPCPAYQQAQFLVEPEKPLTGKPMRFGRGKKPFYITGPNDNYKQIFATLEANVGKGNFDYEIDARSGYHYAE